MAQISMLACDQCRHSPAETWHIGQAGQPMLLVDLCKSCAKPIRELARLGRSSTDTGLRKRFRKTHLPPQP